jgi:hypothetical protein
MDDSSNRLILIWQEEQNPSPQLERVKISKIAKFGCEML